MQELCAHVKKGLLYHDDDRDREYVARLETLVRTLVDPYGSVPRYLFAEKVVKKEKKEQAKPLRDLIPPNSSQIAFYAAPSSATAVAAGGAGKKPERDRPKNDKLQIDPFDDFAIIKA